MDLAALASAWLQEVRSGEDVTDGFGMQVVLMDFTAASETKWQFLQTAVEAAESDDELGAIAAGPFENLLGRNGEEYISLVEARCREDPKFARMTTGAWRHMMSDDVWARIQAIQAAVPDPL